MTEPTTETGLDDPVTVCDHRDERGSTIMQATDTRYECIVCGTRFRLVPEAEARAGLDVDRLARAYRDLLFPGLSDTEPEPGWVRDAQTMARKYAALAQGPRP